MISPGIDIRIPKLMLSTGAILDISKSKVVLYNGNSKHP